MSKALEAVAQNQGLWSTTADQLKAAFERARRVVFLLSAVAALSAAVSSQVDGRQRQVLALVSTVCMGVVAFLAHRQLDSGRSQAWVRARAASEALKQHAYKRAARAAPYDDETTADDLLVNEQKAILTQVDDLEGVRANTGTSSAPIAVIGTADYITRRVTEQAEWHEKKAIAARTAAARWRFVELVLGLTTAAITAVIGSLEKYQLVEGFDFVALTAVLTTLSGTVLAYIEASRYDFIVQSYRVTARRLRDEETSAPATATVPSPLWSAFVDRSEGILQEQNNTWVAKFSKPPAGG